MIAINSSCCCTNETDNTWKGDTISSTTPDSQLLLDFPLSTTTSGSMSYLQPTEAAQVLQIHSDGSALVGEKQPRSRTTLCFFGQKGVGGAHTTAAHNHVCACLCSNCQERLHGIEWGPDLGPLGQRISLHSPPLRHMTNVLIQVWEKDPPGDCPSLSSGACPDLFRVHTDWNPQMLLLLLKKFIILC